MNGFFKKKEEGRSKERGEGREYRRDGRKKGGKTPQTEAERFRKVPAFLQHVVTLNYELMYLLEHFIPIQLSSS